MVQVAKDGSETETVFSDLWSLDMKTFQASAAAHLAVNPAAPRQCTFAIVTWLVADSLQTYRDSVLSAITKPMLGRLCLVAASNCHMQ